MPMLDQKIKPERFQIFYRDGDYDSGGGYHPRGATYAVDTLDQAKTFHPKAIVQGKIVYDAIGKGSVVPHTPERQKLVDGVQAFDAGAPVAAAKVAPVEIGPSTEMKPADKPVEVKAEKKAGER